MLCSFSCITLIPDYFFFPPGQQTGQAPAPRYLCPRLQVFQPLLDFVVAAFFFIHLFFRVRVKLAKTVLIHNIGFRMGELAG